MLFVSPIISSRKAFEIRKKYIKYSLFVFPILSVINLYCYYAGINMMSLDERDVSWDFSAIFWHSMWLGAASGLANIVIFWMQQQPVGNIRKVFYTVWLLISIFLSVVSASRSALVASLIAITYIIYIKSNNIKKLLRYLILILGIVTLTFPFYKKSATRIMNKVEYQQNIGENSRQRAIEARLLDFYESPIFGVGFAVGRDFRTGLKQIGQMESGSGWFSILCQCGLVGFFVIISILLQAYFRVKNKIREDSFLLLLVSILLYQCAHSLFEGYILTSGYYMCILFWGILSLLYVYPIENSKNNK
ncbi:MAG: O-antigen ligase family protein [Rikenellaceae bacterium]